MNVHADTTLRQSTPVGSAAPTVAHILRRARNRVRRSASLVRDLLEGLEMMESILSSKIQGKDVEREDVEAIESLSADFAASFAYEVMGEDGERTLGYAYAAGELEDALEALAYNGTWERLLADLHVDHSVEDLGLDHLVPSICLKELAVLKSVAEEHDDF